MTEVIQLHNWVKVRYLLTSALFSIRKAFLSHYPNNFYIFNFLLVYYGRSSLFEIFIIRTILFQYYPLLFSCIYFTLRRSFNAN